MRKSEGLSQDECAKKLGISKSHLCDVEKGRKTVSPERAAKWAQGGGIPGPRHASAKVEEMQSACRKREGKWKNRFPRLIEVLVRHDVRFIVVGGITAVLQRFP